MDKYCSFMPVEIFLSKANAEQEYETIDAADVREDDVVVETIVEEAKTEERENENGEKEMVEVSPRKEKAKINKRPVSISDTNPLWMKHPNECTDDEYKDFYRKVFNDYKEPLFWIHLNMDYPFNLKGILYFPKVNTEYDIHLEGVIKLYNNQVFIADNIKEVIPEFLMLLKGVIDCPDLPLNVSRSALQNDGFVKKISDYITKKVADKLSGMFKVDRENYEKYWDDISPFIKFGCLKDHKFREKMTDYHASSRIWTVSTSPCRIISKRLRKTSLQKKRQRVQKQRAMKQQMPRMVRMLMIMQRATRKKNRQRYTTQQICSSRASMSIVFKEQGLNAVVINTYDRSAVYFTVRTGRSEGEIPAY